MGSFKTACSSFAVGALLALLPRIASAESTMLIASVETADPAGYARFIKNLTALQQEAGAKLTASVWVPIAAGEDVSVAYYVAEYASAKDWLQSQAIMSQNEKVRAMRQTMDAKRTITNVTTYRQIRDQGEHPDAKVLNTGVRPRDAAAYAKALDQLDQLLDKNGFEDIKLNVWAVSAGGELAGTQLVSLAAPNAERLGAFMDASGAPWIQQWLADAEPLRTLLSNGVYERVSVD